MPYGVFPRFAVFGYVVVEVVAEVFSTITENTVAGFAEITLGSAYGEVSGIVSRKCGVEREGDELTVCTFDIGHNDIALRKGIMYKTAVDVFMGCGKNPLRRE